MYTSLLFVRDHVDVKLFFLYIGNGINNTITERSLRIGRLLNIYHGISIKNSYSVKNMHKMFAVKNK